MVCINSKYVNSDGTKDDAYGTEADGVAVLGFLFGVKNPEDFEPLEVSRLMYAAFVEYFFLLFLLILVCEIF